MQLKLDTTYSVLELNNAVKDVLLSEFPADIWVHGEIQDYDRSKSKRHIFFKLCEKHPDSGQPAAQTTVVIFETTKSKIKNILANAENAFELKDGIEVKFLCSVDFYPKSGSFQLIVQGIDPVYTLGKLSQNKQKIVNELREKGLIDRNKEIPFPEIPLNIGLITAFNSAAYHDFITELKSCGYGFVVYFINSLMQGGKVKHDVCKALKKLEQVPGIDIIVIIRGGGSTADLSCFDDADIAERIALAKVPVITGLGHEIDNTVADIVAHTYLKTPTAAAQFLVKKISDIVEKVNQASTYLIKIVQDEFAREALKLEHYATLLDSGTHKFLAGNREELGSLAGRVRFTYNSLIKNQTEKLNYIKKRLPSLAFVLINDYKLKLQHYTDKISILDPMNTIKRGFSITRSNGKLVKSVKDTVKGQILETFVSDGQIASEVK